MSQNERNVLAKFGKICIETGKINTFPIENSARLLEGFIKRAITGDKDEDNKTQNK